MTERFQRLLAGAMRVNRIIESITSMPIQPQPTEDEAIEHIKVMRRKMREARA